MDNPASNVIRKCGGVAAVSRVCGRSENRVMRWTYPRSRGGTGGIIPADMQVTLLKASQEQGWGLVPADFFPADCLPDGFTASTPAPEEDAA